MLMSLLLFVCMCLGWRSVFFSGNCLNSQSVTLDVNVVIIFCVYVCVCVQTCMRGRTFVRS